MWVYCYDLCGTMAHFRRRSTNTSALTHIIPYRTVLAGITANLLGVAGDQYYSLFSCNNLDIAVSCLTPPRKMVQTLNYLKVTEPNEVNGSNEAFHTQVQMEFLLPTPPDVYLVYRIWLHPKGDFLNGPVMERLKELFEKPGYRTYGSPVGLGIRSCLGWTENQRKGELIEYGNSGSVELSSSVLLDNIVNLSADQLPGCKILREDSILEMDAKRQITPNAARVVVFNTHGHLRCEVKSYSTVRFGEEVVNISWLK